MHAHQRLEQSLQCVDVEATPPSLVAEVACGRNAVSPDLRREILVANALVTTVRHGLLGRIVSRNKRSNWQGSPPAAEVRQVFDCAQRISWITLDIKVQAVYPTIG